MRDIAEAVVSFFAVVGAVAAMIIVVLGIIIATMWPVLLGLAALKWLAT